MSHAIPIGYAMSWMTNVVTVTLGLRREKSMLTAEPTVHSTRPMTHARTVLEGRSSS